MVFSVQRGRSFARATAPVADAFRESCIAQFARPAVTVDVTVAVVLWQFWCGLLVEKCRVSGCVTNACSTRVWVVDLPRSTLGSSGNAVSIHWLSVS